METLKLTIDKIFGFVPKETVYSYKKDMEAYNTALDNKTGKGNDYLGWVNLPSSINESELKDIENVAASLKKNCEVVVVVGIGGSYLGAKMAIEALSNSFQLLQKKQKC